MSKLSPICLKKHNNKIVLHYVMCKLGIHRVDACLDWVEAEVVYSPLRNNLNLVLRKLCYYSAVGWVDCDLEDWEYLHFSDVTETQRTF